MEGLNLFASHQSLCESLHEKERFLGHKESQSPKLKQQPTPNDPTTSESDDDVVPDHEAPDGGWGWLVCVTCFMSHGVLMSMMGAFGFIYVELLEKFEGQTKNIAFACSFVGVLHTSLAYLLSPVSSACVARLGIRATACLGLTIYASGFLISSFVESLWLLYLSYGVLNGIGSALLLVPLFSILSHYFRKKLGLANSIVSVGSPAYSIGAGFLLSNILLKHLSLANTFRVLAGIIFINVPFVLTWKPLLKTGKNSDGEGGCTNAMSGLRDVFKNRDFLVFAISAGIGQLGTMVPFVHMINFSNHRFPDHGEYTTWLFLVFNLGSVLARSSMGTLSDRKWAPKRVRFIQLGFFLLGVGISATPLSRHFWVYMLCSFVTGFGDGTVASMVNPVAVGILGAEQASDGLGVTFALMAVPLAVSGPLAGLAFDHTDSYLIPYLVGGMPGVLGACLMFLMPSEKLCRKQGQSQPEFSVQIR